MMNVLKTVFKIIMVIGMTVAANELMDVVIERMFPDTIDDE